MDVGAINFRKVKVIYMSMEINNTNSGVTSQIMDLKTSKPGVTRKEEIKTGFNDVKEYSKYLQEKYSYMNTGANSIHGVSTLVEVSSSFLRKCMKDPQKAAFLEENLAAIPNCVKMAKSGCIGTVTNLKYMCDANGNLSVAISTTNDPDGKIAKENAEKKAEEKKEAEEKLAKRRAERKAIEEQLAKMRAENATEAKEFTVTFTGSSIESITQIMTERFISAGSTGSITSGFDMKV